MPSVSPMDSRHSSAMKGASSGQPAANTAEQNKVRTAKVARISTKMLAKPSSNGCKEN